MSYFKVRNPLNEKQALVSGSSDIVASDILGQGFPSVVEIDDAAPASSSVLWTSDKIDGAFQALASPAVAGDLATLDASGQVVDSGLKVDDAAPASSSVVWTSDKIDGAFQALVNPAVAGDLATLDASGQVVDSGLKVDDAAVPSTGVVYSSDKVVSLISGSSKAFVRGNFDFTTLISSPTFLTVLSCTTPDTNQGGAWSSNVFTAPTSAVYAVGAILQSDSSNGALGDTFWELRMIASTGQSVINADIIKTPLPGAWNFTTTASGAFYLNAGDTIKFIGIQNTGFVHGTKTGDYCSFYVAQL
jgi:hypothetical protein